MTADVQNLVLKKIREINLNLFVVRNSVCNHCQTIRTKMCICTVCHVYVWGIYMV